MEMAIITDQRVSYCHDACAHMNVTISNFKVKQRSTKFGVSVKTNPFYVGLATFKMEIFISGRSPGENCSIILLHNESGRPVKARVNLYQPFSTRTLPSDHPFSVLRPFRGHGQEHGDCCLYSWGTFIPLDQRLNNLLNYDGSLDICLHVQVFDEVVCGGNSVILQKLEQLSSQLKETKKSIEDLKNQQMFHQETQVKVSGISLL